MIPVMQELSDLFRFLDSDTLNATSLLIALS